MVMAAIVGTVLGFLAGLGVGGGSLLLLWLTGVTGMPQEAARGINLLFFLPAAAISCAFRRKQGTLDFKQMLPAILGGCLAAGIFAAIAPLMDTALLKKLFGGLLIFTGIREVFYRPK